ncbi:MAG TPA: nuclear transport factor 2 family protein [Terriglobales bacterium]|nr:nuclear transport factor 2 family protein [Terriglobales bacterium]
MVKRILVALVFLTTCATAFLPRLARGGSSAEQDVRNLEQRWLQNEDDPAALESILAPDFIHVGRYGFVTKQQQIDFMRKHVRADSEKRVFEELRIRVYGEVAIANGIVRATGRTAADVKLTAFTDVFVRRKGTWQAVNAQESPLDRKN